MKFFKNENVPNLLGQIARDKIKQPLIRIMQICYGSAGMSVAEKDTIQKALIQLAEYIQKLEIESKVAFDNGLASAKYEKRFETEKAKKASAAMEVLSEKLEQSNTRQVELEEKIEDLKFLCESYQKQIKTLEDLIELTKELNTPKMIVTEGVEGGS